MLKVSVNKIMNGFAGHQSTLWPYYPCKHVIRASSKRTCSSGKPHQKSSDVLPLSRYGRTHMFELSKWNCKLATSAVSHTVAQAISPDDVSACKSGPHWLILYLRRTKKDGFSVYVLLIHCLQSCSCCYFSRCRWSSDITPATYLATNIEKREIRQNTWLLPNCLTCIREVCCSNLGRHTC
jgi:hypothetical protein